GVSSPFIRSPLILFPAVLSIDALNSPYKLSKYEDDIVLNPKLQYYLKTEYGVELPGFDHDRDTLESYFESLEKIADKRGWRIIREASLSLLSFLKISMYNDLLRNEERIKSNPVVRAMSGEAGAANDIPEELRTFDLDSIKTLDCYQVMSADSSQQDAILYSKNNISFVMQGPPGTGKSQTITNIIAEALADGKKILFVSEKMAALQVVYRRLQDAHLADFCLPLHSYKANKKEILEQLGANLDLKQTRVKDTAISNLEELLSIRKELNQYAEELHRLNPELNISCYEVYSKLEEVSDAPSVSFDLVSPLDISQAELHGYLNKLKEYTLALRRINYKIHNNPWKGLTSRVTGREYTERMRKELGLLGGKLSSMLECIGEIGEAPGLRSSLTYAEMPSFIESLGVVCRLPEIPRNWLNKDALPHLISEAEEAGKQYEKLACLEEDINTTFGATVFSCDYNAWKKHLSAEAGGFALMPFIKNKQKEHFIKNAVPLREAFAKVHMELKIADSSFDAINSILGTDFAANIPNNRRIAELISLIDGNEIIEESWFTAEPGIIKEQIG
ncbi:MAG: hypothetical protein IJW21_07915, partial [Clostridia bacterium]|nr:hypothetical protein [Clostridia bacterium]